MKLATLAILATCLAGLLAACQGQQASQDTGKSSVTSASLAVTPTTETTPTPITQYSASQVIQNAQSVWQASFTEASILIYELADRYAWNRTEALALITDYAEELLSGKYRIKDYTPEILVLYLPEIAGRTKYLNLHYSNDLKTALDKYKVIAEEISYCHEIEVSTPEGTCINSLWQLEVSLRVSQFNDVSEVINDYANRHNWPVSDLLEGIGIINLSPDRIENNLDRIDIDIGGLAEMLGILAFIDLHAPGGVLEASSFFSFFHDIIKFCAGASDNDRTLFWNEFFWCLEHSINEAYERIDS